MKSNNIAIIINHRLLLLAVTAMLVFAQCAFCGTYGGGAGTAEEPYIIADPNHMQEIGENEGDWDKHFLMTTDIDLSAAIYDTALVAPDEDNSNGSYDGTPFNGIFDGGGHTITGFITSSFDCEYTGLFGYVGSNGEIRNLELKDVDIQAEYGFYVGGLAGYNVGGITNCSVSGSVNGYLSTGGLAGKNKGSITDCNVSIIMGGNSYLGGLVGWNDGSIENCNSEGTVISDSYDVGGTAGYNEGIITDCLAACRVEGTSEIGGVVGYNMGELSRCCGLGDIRGSYSIGGLVGINYESVSESYATGKVISFSSYSGGLVGYNEGAIRYCYATGNVKGDRSVGGLAGANSYHSEITYCYAMGEVSGNEYIGGLVGVGGNYYTDYYACLWNIEANPDIKGISNVEDPYDVVGKTISEMQTQITYTDMYWDFVGESLNGIDDLWYLPECGFAVLSWQPVGVSSDVSGLSKAEAVSSIESLGLPVYVIKVHSESVPTDHVIGQEPVAGCETALVTLFVSDGFPYESGLGTEESPYQISTVEQMNAIRAYPEDWNKHFILSADIDLGGYVYSTAVIAWDSDMSEGKFVGTAFTGVFDGKGYVVRNLTIEAAGPNDGYLGLFGVNEGSLRNLGLENVSITDRTYSNYVGGLASVNNGSISNCYSAGTVNGYYYIGGLAGCNTGTISYCYSVCSVNGNISVGGLTGNCVDNGSVDNSYAIGRVSGDRHVGGLIGRNSECVIENCYSASRVRYFGYKTSVGAFVGENEQGVYNNCFWDINVNESLAGEGYNSWYTEGIIGKETMELQIQDTYTEMNWDFVGESENGSEDIWSMSGCGYPVLSWQEIGVVPEVVGLVEGEAIEAISSAVPVLVTKATHSKTIDAGVVISQEPAAGCEAAMVTIVVSDGFPYGGGVGSEEDPYQIWSAEEMNEIGIHKQDWNKDFVLMSDIDLSAYTGKSFNTIQDIRMRFQGVFDGKGHTISNFMHTFSDGIFAYLDRGGHIRNLGIIDVSVESEEYAGFVGSLVGRSLGTITNCYATGSLTGYAYVGLLVGYNSGDIIDCYACGDVSGESYIGVLVGSNHGTLRNCYCSGTVYCSAIDRAYASAGGLAGANEYGEIINCYSTGTVTGDSKIGLLTGKSEYGEIINCYSTGSVTGNTEVGGLVGYNNSSSITNSYAAVGVSGNSEVGGLVGSSNSGDIASCFWDSQVNPSLTGVGNIDDPVDVMGKTTAQLKTQTTFTDHGWDFTNEDANGTDDFWRLCVDGAGYPRLAWEYDSIGDFLCPDGVAFGDLSYFVENWLSADSSTDINGDGVTNLSDYVILAQHWLE